MEKIIHYIIIFLFLLGTQQVFGGDIKIGVYRSHTIHRIDFTYLNGNYKVYGDTFLLGDLGANDFVSITRNGSLVQLKRNNEVIGSYRKIFLRALSGNAGLKLKPRSPVLKERAYYNDFELFAGGKGVTIVNDVSFRHYLGGVVESEGGGGRHLEYYKAQAVISRTYALKHFRRHQKDGFNLCDQVHCQAYFNRLLHTPTIDKAVLLTDGVYVEDSVSNTLLEAYFHANCGGETIGSDYVWKQEVRYLQPVKDTFCINTRQATWEKKIPKSEWRSFLVNTYFYPVKDSVYNHFLYKFEQDQRKAFYLSPHLGIPLRDLRYKFNLKSTFFSTAPEGDYVVLKGRGFGHGVGLCQEGAMEMAKQGFNYKEILSFYYAGIRFKYHFEDLFFEQPIVTEIGF